VLLFLFAVIVIFFSEKKTEFLLAVLFITAAILFKTDFLVELRIGLFVS
jgi:hypothetical protein